MKLEKEKAEELVKRLKEKGAKEEKPPEYAAYRLKLGGGELTIYESGSVVYSGKEREKVKETVIGELLNIEEKLPRIGCDEAGKGEFFGPLVVACVCADRNCLKELLELEIKDSKKLKEEQILKLAERIKSVCTGVVRVVPPEKYNREYDKFKNLNRYLEEIYRELLEKLLQKCKAREVVVDRFSSRVEKVLREEFKGVEIFAKVKGEADPVVAAASIVAKAERLKMLRELSRKLGIEVREGNLNNRELLKKIPQEKLSSFVKLHFNIRERE